MDAEKLMQAAGYILKKYKYRLNYTKLIKLLYLADKEAFRESNRSISGDSYACMKSGPVLSGLYDLIKGKYPAASVQLAWNTRYSTDGCDLTANFDRLPEKKLSVFEKRLMDRIDASFHKKPYYSMINYVHNPDICPEWKEPGNTSVPLKVEDILKSVGRSEEETAWVIAEQEAFEEEDKLIDIENRAKKRLEQEKDRVKNEITTYLENNKKTVKKSFTSPLIERTAKTC